MVFLQNGQTLSKYWKIHGIFWKIKEIGEFMVEKLTEVFEILENSLYYQKIDNFFGEFMFLLGKLTKFLKILKNSWYFWKTHIIFGKIMVFFENWQLFGNFMVFSEN